MSASETVSNVGDALGNVGDALWNTGEASVSIAGSTAKAAGSTLEAGSSVIEAGSKVIVKLADGTEKIVDFSSEKVGDLVLWIEEEKPPIGLPGIDANDPDFFKKHLEAYNTELQKWQGNYGKANAEYQTLNSQQNYISIQNQSKKNRIEYINDRIVRLNETLSSISASDPAGQQIRTELENLETQRASMFQTVEQNDPYVQDNFFGYTEIKLNEYFDLLEKYMEGCQQNIDFFGDQVQRCVYWVGRVEEEKAWKEEEELKKLRKERLNRAGERIGDLYEAGMPLADYFVDYLSGDDMEDRSLLGAFGKQIISPYYIVDSLSGDFFSDSISKIF